MTNYDHPFFTALYRRIVRWEDSGSVGKARDRIAHQLTGRVLIVGLGPGQDLLHLPASVSSVEAVEPSASMRRSAANNIEQARERGIEVNVIAAAGEAIPLPDNCVDSALIAFVLCTVTNPAQVLSEVKRVVRPAGPIAVLEHVQAPPRTFTRVAQRSVRRLWPHMAGGCHPDRDTRAIMEGAGLSTAEIEDTKLVNVPPVSPAILGVTRNS